MLVQYQQFVYNPIIAYNLGANSIFDQSHHQNRQSVTDSIELYVNKQTKF